MTETDRDRSPKVVAIGGGTGLPNTLRACAGLTGNLSAVISVADNGGSSGRLRQQFDVPPPGDIRSCMQALAADDNMRSLFEYRFSEGEDLKGHSLGNLILTALWLMERDFIAAIDRACAMLSATGEVLPAAESGVTMGAEFMDGSSVLGQIEIINHRGSIRRVFITDDTHRNPDRVREAVNDADYIIIGPGSLYTSLIVTLITGELFKTILNSSAKVIYIVNAMMQPGETTGYTASRHVQAIYEHTAEGLIDEVIVSSTTLNDDVVSAYAAYGASPVINDEEALKKMGLTVNVADLLSTDMLVRHDLNKLHKALRGVICPSMRK